MTRHVLVGEHGRFLGLQSGLLVVRGADRVHAEVPLSRLATLTVAKPGIALSSDLVLAAAARGIRMFFLDFRGAVAAMLHGAEQHATVAVRRRQLAFSGEPARELARAFVLGKLANQRAVLRYFAKYHEKQIPGPLLAAADAIGRISAGARCVELAREDWRSLLLGHEGEAAARYFAALREAGLLPPSFTARLGRGATEITNAALNLGYAVLQTRVWTCLLNAGLECYAGVLHEERPGRPSLVLDAMEEHRPYVVDRPIIAMRAQLSGRAELDSELRRNVVNAVHEMLDRRIAHRGRKLRVETLIQRQAYRLAGAFCGTRTYRALRYPW
jgi:CRISPR-associated protein Cas1